jgi:hypothetical protein
MSKEQNSTECTITDDEIKLFPSGSTGLHLSMTVLSRDDWKYGPERKGIGEILDIIHDNGTAYCQIQLGIGTLSVPVKFVESVLVTHCDLKQTCLHLHKAVIDWGFKRMKRK